MFYRLSESPVAAALPLLASKTLERGSRLLVVEADPTRAQALSDALWGWREEAFLANGLSGGDHDTRQPILIRPDVGEGEPANGASFVAYADGVWREPPPGTERVMLLFDEATIGGARDTWRLLADRDGVERQFWKQQNGRWVQGP
ncbi:DNA polymerase III subunit chi [Novosphingobium ovatum]|nr:DNA polymerase III subunit chi [Novosphingobium ovatum]